MNKYFYAIFKPIVKFIGKLHAPYSNCLVTAEDYVNFRAFIKPGDVVLTRGNGELTNLFIDGFFKHATLFTDNNNIIEATGNGVGITETFDLLKRVDYFVILRYKHYNISQGFKPLFKFLGKEYDYTFEAKNDSFYCSELVLAVLEYLSGHKIFPNKKIAYPIDIYKDAVNFKVIYISKALRSISEI